jgi:hypothetical protein
LPLPPSPPPHQQAPYSSQRTCTQRSAADPPCNTNANREGGGSGASEVRECAAHSMKEDTGVSGAKGNAQLAVQGGGKESKESDCAVGRWGGGHGVTTSITHSGCGGGVAEGSEWTDLIDPQKFASAPLKRAETPRHSPSLAAGAHLLHGTTVLAYWYKISNTDTGAAAASTSPPPRTPPRYTSPAPAMASLSPCPQSASPHKAHVRSAATAAMWHSAACYGGVCGDGADCGETGPAAAASDPERDTPPSPPAAAAECVSPSLHQEEAPKTLTVLPAARPSPTAAGSSDVGGVSRSVSEGAAAGPVPPQSAPPTNTPVPTPDTPTVPAPSPGSSSGGGVTHAAGVGGGRSTQSVRVFASFFGGGNFLMFLCVFFCLNPKP